MSTINDFNESSLAEAFVNQRLQDHFLWSPELGWLEWDGKRWAHTVMDRVKEVGRQWVLSNYENTAQALADRAQKGVTDKTAEEALRLWRGYTYNSRVRALVSLAQGMLLRDGEDFDADPDLFNCANGIIDLRTGELLEHDPEALMTKISDVEYQPDAIHPDWDAALSALPDDAREWYQIRAGQGLTGYTPNDDRVVVQFGSGANGKSCIIAGIRAAAGEYYHLISPRALLADPSAHPTEIAAFKGARVAFLDELPDEKRINMANIKRLVGSEQVTGRFIGRDSVTFDITWSMFLNTNHLQGVTETDTATWRRLYLLPFTKHFVETADEVKSPADILADSGLRPRIRMGKEGQHEAALAWMVKGAGKWYANGGVASPETAFPPPPESVVVATREWRKSSDHILRFISDHLEFDANSYILVSDLRPEFNKWMEDQGHRVYTEQTFNARFTDHDIVRDNNVLKKTIRSTTPGRSQPPALAAAQVGWRREYGNLPSETYDKQPQTCKAWLGVRFR